MRRIDKENERLITVHPTQLKMKHRHETSERHILHRHILTAMTKQCNHKQKTRSLSLFVGSVGWMYSSREAIIPLSLPVLFLPHVERNGSGKAWLRIQQVPCACSLQGPIYFPCGAVLPLALLSSGDRCVVCSRWDRCRLSLDTNYLIEIWAAERSLLFVVICCVTVSRWPPLGAEVCCDFKI